MIIHPVLKRQLKRLNISEDQVPTIDQWNDLLNRIERTYFDSDQGQYLNELSINVSSREMAEQNQKLAEAIKQLHKTQDALIKSEKKAAIGQISAGVAHEINNPLTYVLGNIGILDKRSIILLQAIDFYKNLISQLPNKPLNEIESDIINFESKNKILKIISDLNPVAEEIKEGLYRIKQIIINLNNVANKKIEPLQEIDINECLKSAIKNISEKSAKQVGICSDFGNLPKILGVFTELELSFIILLSNAIQAISENGQITVSSIESNSYILIKITDNGCGISEENLAKLFLPFFTTQTATQSVGLGLATAYAIIDLHGGTIAVESKLDYGSTFTVSLPVKS